MCKCVCVCACMCKCESMYLLRECIHALTLECVYACTYVDVHRSAYAYVCTRLCVFPMCVRVSLIEFVFV